VIIDVSKQAEAEALVGQYGCDTLLAMDESPETLAFIERFPWLKIHDEQSLFYEGDPGDSYPRFADIRTAAANFIEHGEPFEWLSFRPDHEAIALLVILFGDLPSRDSRIPIEYADALAKNHLLRSEMQHTLPTWPMQYVTGFGSRGIRHEPVRRQMGIVVGQLDDADTLLTLWNLRAACVSATAYDPTRPAESEKWLRWFIQDVQPALDTLDIEIYCEPDKAPPALLALLEEPAPGGRLRSIYSNAAIALQSTAEYPSRIYGARTSQTMLQSKVRDEAVHLEFMAQPLRRAWRHGCKYVLEIHGSIHPSGSKSLTFKTPYVPLANRQLAGLTGSIPRDIFRAQLNGFGVIVEPSKAAIFTRGASGNEIATALFDAVKVQAELSDAGRYTAQLISYMGGLRRCRVFQIPGVRAIIGEAAKSRSITASRALQRIRGADATPPELERFADVILARGQRRPLTNEHVWTLLLKRRVFVPGVELKCDRCSLAFWLSIDEVRSVVACPYCALEMVVAAQLKSNLSWAYRRSPLLSVDATLHGAIPVILTVMQLYRAFDRHVIAWSTSTNLNFSRLEKCETDFVMCLGSDSERSSLIIGECKTGDSFTSQDLANLSRAATLFETTDLRVFIVFANLNVFSPTELEMIRRLPDGMRHRIVLLDATQLESDTLFAGEPRTHIIDIADLARASAGHYQYWDAAALQHNGEQP
jgi:DNA-directed RNA polymerase subunit RPC12/RpoP